MAIVPEFQQDARIIPLDSRVGLSERPQQWKGVSQGRWEGDSLVVETTHFNGRDTFRGHGPNLHMVERLTRVDAVTMHYEYTVNDGDTFTRPWSALLSMKLSDDPLYEYACHEGNYSVPLILSGGRAQERAEHARP